MEWLFGNWHWVPWLFSVILAGVIVWLRGEQSQQAALEVLWEAVAESLRLLIAAIAALAHSTLSDVTQAEVYAVAEKYYDKLVKLLPAVASIVSLEEFQKHAWEWWQDFVVSYTRDGPMAMRALETARPFPREA